MTGLDIPLAGKDVIIIGNAQSLFDHDHSALINYHDVVVRMNAGVELNHRQIELTTDRCDMYTGSGSFFDLSRCTVEEPEWLVYMTPKGREGLHENIQFYPLEWWRVLFTELGEARPSTGIMTIDMCLRLGGKVSIVGFDWYTTPTFYGTHASPVHNFCREKDWIEHMPVEVI